LPFQKIRLTARKPKDSVYPKELKTLGDQLRKRRLDLGLLQREVARILGVDVDSVGHWETGRSQPKVPTLPRIIDFLGYLPNEPVTTFAGTLRTARRSAGLSQENLAHWAGIDESTIAKWERGETLPVAATVERLRRYFDEIGRPLPEFGPEAFYGPERRAEAARRAWRARQRALGR
jgi:transcriptional regulator with XRE-family HTH domain